MSMANKIGKQYRYKFVVSIKEPKDGPKLEIAEATKSIGNSALYSGQYKKEHLFMFNLFSDANEFYLDMANKLDLTNDTYKNKRYTQLVNDNAPEFTKDNYLDLISNFDIQ